ncbi:short transient receptor potential channel 6-like [Diachasma alloeum]|uniref:short transient receptor potential channel 6-like n=1 Tax=Diachasma alloeum TaxID=454923 RepID=UPI0007384B63|nr:short transient receptor potential channel 6-like [Diachasma alloeum]
MILWSIHSMYNYWNVFAVVMSPILAGELLFFAIFGQTTHEQFKVVGKKSQQPWTTVFFKLAFGIYMLVSVVVLINLLIAMMSDTYQRIQAQSDIEWKYGLSKLFRNMHRTTTAPSPLNLVTTWMTYFCRLCKKRTAKKQRPSLIHLMSLHRSSRMSPRTKVGAKWLSKIKRTQVAHNDSVAVPVGHLSPLGSQLSFSNALRIDTVVDWDEVRRKYRALFCDEPEKIAEETPDMAETEQLTIIEETAPLPSTNNIPGALL